MGAMRPKTLSDLPVLASMLVLNVTKVFNLLGSVPVLIKASL